MATTESTMLELGTTVPHFTLPIVTGGTLNFNNYTKKSKGTVIAFICNHCPYVKHINPALVEIASHYIQQGVGFIATNPNDIENYPDDSPENMIETAKKEGYPFPYLFDETQEVAKAFKAACTPDFFVFDETQKLVYRGRFDSSTPKNGVKVTGTDLKDAIECMLSGEINEKTQIPSIGCSIKWKPGNEPNYYG